MILYYRCHGEIFPSAISGIDLQSEFRYHIADSAQKEYCSTFHCRLVCVQVTGITSELFSII